MAAYTSILLLAALCIGTAYSLKCYICNAATSDSNCKTPFTCPSGENYCQTVTVSASIDGYNGYFINKSCTSICTSSSYSISTSSGSISCCSTDLCNVNEAISIKSTYSAIFLVLGTIVMLFSISLL